MSRNSLLRPASQLLVAVGIALGSLAASAASFSQLIVFGDSLSDPGNASAMTGGAFPPFPYAGTFSNGPVAAQYMASALGIGSSNYAIGGAMTNAQNYLALTEPALAPVLSNTGISAQISSWSPAGVDTSTALFMVWGGPNDFSYNFGLAGAGVPVDFSAVVANTVGNIAADITALALKGGQSFVVPGMPDLGLTPRATANGPGFAALAGNLSAGYNAALDATLDSLESSLGIHIYRFDTAAYMQGIIADPASVGLSNVTDSCISAGASVILGGCTGYLYFDDIHPTTQAHALLGAQFAQAVPEPGQLAMLFVGLGVLGLVRRRMAA